MTREDVIIFTIAQKCVRARNAKGLFLTEMQGVETSIDVLELKTQG